MPKLAGVFGLPVNLFGVLAGILLALITGSVLRIFVLAWRRKPPDEVRKRLGSLLTWWFLYGVLLLVVFFGVHAGAVVFGLLSLLGLKEYRRLAERRIAGTAPWWWTYAAVPVHYLLIWLGWFGPSWTFIPVWVLFALLARMAVAGATEDFLETAGIMFLGLMLVVFLLSHAVLILNLPERSNPVAGTEGLFVYLVLLTEGNDIAQALVGRRYGKRKMAPQVSPHKTWEGFLSGIGITVLLALLLGPLLTPFRAGLPATAGMASAAGLLPAAAAGVLIAVGGFLGDITMSAIKREVGVKDSGAILPGQGGVLDRIDSLTFTAPLLFYFTYLFFK
jgi:phosphatidate cytidylyltransferase